VLVQLDARGNSYVVALDLRTGRRLWQVDYSRGLNLGTALQAAEDKPFEVNDGHGGLAQHVGVARYTLTADGSKVFARLGSPVTVPSPRRAALWLAKDQGFLLGLDLATQGKPLEGFPIRPPGSDWSFEGTPLAHDGASYVAMRRTEAGRSQIFAAAFELQTTATAIADDRDDNARPGGRLKWRTRICSAAPVGGGQFDELTNVLVTLDGGRLYVNTHSGAIAAISAPSGQLLWLLKYPRVAARESTDRPGRHLARDLAPCLAWKDLIIAAPADSDRIFALEAATGQLAWTLPSGAADDAVHLLGVENDVLVASGDFLYWIDASGGRLLTQFPAGHTDGGSQAAPSPRGLGRGLIAGEHIWWPTRQSILIFDVRPDSTNFGPRPRLLREIPLAPRDIAGGNLVIADGILLIATGDRLAAFGQ
jgi:outer membrane protein assembly factor BamB